MKRISDWALLISLSFLLTALLAFVKGFFMDAIQLALYGVSGIFFIMSPQRTKDYRWNNFKVLSYLFFLCAVAVSIFKYLFWEPI